MRRFPAILQYLVILAAFAAAWFIPVAKSRPAQSATAAHASAPR